MKTNTFHNRVAPVVLLLLHAALLGFSSSRHNPTIDEAGHLVAGLSHWSFGRFELYNVNPPLVRMCAALPLLATDYHEQWAAAKQFSRPEFDLGREFISANAESSVWLFALCRCALIPFSLLGGGVCWIWARELYGRECGTVALCLWCFSPNVLAYGQLIVPDMAATALGVTAWYLFWQWLKAPSRDSALLASLALGILQLTKMTWLILFPVWPITWLGYRLASGSKGSTIRPLRKEGGQLVMIAAGAIGILNLGYGFEQSFQRLDQFEFRSDALTGNRGDADTPCASNRFRGTWLGGLPVPLPANYLRGLDTQRLDFESKLWSYLRGSWRRGGWWYYYLYALAIKVPLGAWCALGLATVLTVYRPSYFTQARDEAFLLAPAVAVVAFVSTQTGFNHHIRYVLPAFPFMMIFASKVARAAKGHRAVRALTSVALTWSVVSSLSVYPHSLSYFNGLAGGPKGGHSHLLNSNVDWGQDILFLRRWLQRHPEVQLAGLAYEYQKIFDPAVVGIGAPKPPVDVRWARLDVNKDVEVGPRPGWYAVSVSLLHDRMHGFDYFNEYGPDSRAGYSILIYHLSMGEANRVRRKLGLRELVARPTGQGRCDGENKGLQ